MQRFITAGEIVNHYNIRGITLSIHSVSRSLTHTNTAATTEFANQNIL